MDILNKNQKVRLLRAIAAGAIDVSDAMQKDEITYLSEAEESEYRELAALLYPQEITTPRGKVLHPIPDRTVTLHPQEIKELFRAVQSGFISKEAKGLLNEIRNREPKEDNWKTGYIYRAYQQYNHLKKEYARFSELFCKRFNI